MPRTTLRIECPFCRGFVFAGGPDCVVVHTAPECTRFRDLETDEFLAEINKVKTKAAVPHVEDWKES